MLMYIEYTYMMLFCLVWMGIRSMSMDSLALAGFGSGQPGVGVHQWWTFLWAELVLVSFWSIQDG